MSEFTFRVVDFRNGFNFAISISSIKGRRRRITVNICNCFRAEFAVGVSFPDSGRGVRELYLLVDHISG